MFKESFFRWLARVFVPAWAKELEQEDIFHLLATKDVAVNEADYILVENNHADVTIFVFSGLDGLFAGGPRFEFRNLFAKLGRGYNVVFVRELRGYFYHAAPDGSWDGLAFYENRLNQIKQDLGATYNLSMGFSAGGMAACYFGTRCGMQKIIAFCPSFPLTVYTSRRALLRHLFDVRKLLFDFKGYVEVSLVSIWGLLSSHRLHKAVGRQGEWDVLDTYCNYRKPRPAVTIVFGTGSRQDARQAAGLAHLPEVKLRPVDTGFHNVPGTLKQRGELATLLTEELQELLQPGPAASAPDKAAVSNL